MNTECPYPDPCATLTLLQLANRELHRRLEEHTALSQTVLTACDTMYDAMLTLKRAATRAANA